MDRDHDLLTKIDANLSNFMQRFDSHVAEDKENFKKVREWQERLTEGQDWLKKYAWLLMGIIAAIEFFAHQVFK